MQGGDNWTAMLEMVENMNNGQPQIFIKGARQKQVAQSDKLSEQQITGIKEELKIAREDAWEKAKIRHTNVWARGEYVDTLMTDARKVIAGKYVVSVQSSHF